MKIRLLLPVLVLLAFLPAKAAVAKCAYSKYTITGTVQDDLTRQAISSATLFLFFDDKDSALSDDPNAPDFFSTNTDGIFVATGLFPTDSGWLFFDS